MFRLQILLLFILIVFLDSTGSFKPKSFSGDGRIRVAVFADNGVGEEPGTENEYARNIEITIKAFNPQCETGLVKAVEIAAGALKEYDVVIFPGGSGMTQSLSLGEDGRAAVVDFVKNGGGFIGICAGAYLGQDMDLSQPALKISNAEVLNGAVDWDRGGGIVRARINKSYLEYFPEFTGSESFYLNYQSGPVFIPAGRKDMDPYEELIVFESDIFHDSVTTKGEAPGKAMFIVSEFGKGMTLLMSSHAEETPGLKWMLYRMVEIAARQDLSPVPAKYVDFKKYSKEIMYDAKWRDRETRYIKIAKDKTKKAKERINALKILKNIGSKEAARLSVRLLNDKSNPVKKYAAEMIVFYDYFPAIDRLNELIKKESSPETVKAFRKAVAHLSPEPKKKKTVIVEKTGSKAHTRPL
jgi:hypothetical protein